MYSRGLFRRLKGVVPEFVPSTDAGVVNTAKINSTSLCGYTTRILGRMFSITLECTTGIVYIRPDSTTITTTNSFAIREGGVIDLQVDNYLGVLGNSTTAALQAIVWSDG